MIDEVAHPDAIETLLALPDAQPDPTGSHRVRIRGTKVEIIGVGPVSDDALDGLTEMQTLFVSAHTWALATAMPVTLVSAAEPTVRATAPFATPAALFAMKLHAIQDRRPTSRPEKRSSDAIDLYRLLLQLDTYGSLRTDLATAPSILRHAVRAADPTSLDRRRSADPGLVVGIRRPGWPSDGGRASLPCPASGQRTR